MHKKDIVNFFLLLVVLGLSLFIYLSPGSGTQHEEAGQVLGDRVAADKGDVPFNLFVEGLASKRQQYGETNCDFVVSEETDGKTEIWEGELIWSDYDDFKIFLDGGKRIFLVNKKSIYTIHEDGSRESLGRIDDDGKGFSTFLSIRDYVFDSFLLEASKDPSRSKLVGEESIDGKKYFILENDISVSNPSKEIKQKFWVSEEGIFLKAEIEDVTNDYEVYDSTGVAVDQKGSVKNIRIEVKNRAFS